MDILNNMKIQKYIYKIVVLLPFFSILRHIGIKILVLVIVLQIHFPILIAENVNALIIKII